MRGTPIVAGLLLALVGLAGPLGCSDEPIGQPCTFSWPDIPDPTDPTGTRMIKDCASFPVCQPLQAGIAMGGTPQNDACPVDCIQLPSLQCTNLICVATQVEEGDSGQDPWNVMNGQCSDEVVQSDCPTAAFGCMGYCTKECLSDSSCPKGYKCSPMAPFGENMRCDDEDLWGDGSATPGSPDPTKQCTNDCVPTGGTPSGTSVTCPSSRLGDANYGYEDCDQKDYQGCCTCMCDRYCPLLTKKFCRKRQWDDDMFPEAITTRGDCRQDD
jgi:hypothetical protein